MAWENPWFKDYMQRAGLHIPPPGGRIEVIADHETISGYSVVVENHGTHAMCYGCDGRGSFCWRQELPIGPEGPGEGLNCKGLLDSSNDQPATDAAMGEQMALF